MGIAKIIKYALKEASSLKKSASKFKSIKEDGFTNSAIKGIAKKYGKKSLNKANTELSNAKKTLDGINKDSKLWKRQFKKVEKLQKKVDNKVDTMKNGLKNKKYMKFLKTVKKGGKYGLVGSILTGLGSGVGTMASNAMSNAMSNSMLRENIRKMTGDLSREAAKNIRKELQLYKDKYGEDSQISEILANANLNNADTLDFLKNLYRIVKAKEGWVEEDFYNIERILNGQKNPIYEQYRDDLYNLMFIDKYEAKAKKSFEKKYESLLKKNLNRAMKSDANVKQLVTGKGREVFLEKLKNANIETLQDVSETLKKLSNWKPEDGRDKMEDLFDDLRRDVDDNIKTLNRSDKASNASNVDNSHLSEDIRSLRRRSDEANSMIKDLYNKFGKYINQSPDYSNYERSLMSQSRSLALISTNITNIRKALVDDQDTRIKHSDNIKVEINPEITVDNRSVNERLKAMEEAINQQSNGLMGTVKSLLSLGAGMASMYAFMKLMENNNEGNAKTERDFASQLEKEFNKSEKEAQEKEAQEKESYLRSALNKAEMAYAGFSLYQLLGGDSKIKNIKNKMNNKFRKYPDRYNRKVISDRTFHSRDMEYRKNRLKYDQNSPRLNNRTGNPRIVNSEFEVVDNKSSKVKKYDNLNTSPTKKNIPNNKSSIITKNLDKITKSKLSKTVAKQIVKRVPFLGGALSILDTALTVKDIEARASSASTQEEKDRIRGEEYGRESVRYASSLIGAALGAFGGPAGAFLGYQAGDMVGELLSETFIGDWAAETGADVAKWTTDNDIMEELDDKGIIDYDYIGGSSILDRKALRNLSADDIKKLIDFDDFNKSDTEYLKYLYALRTGKIRNKTDSEFTEDINDLKDMMKEMNAKVDRLKNPDDKKIFDRIIANPESTNSLHLLNKLRKHDKPLADLIVVYIKKLGTVKEQLKYEKNMSSDEFDKLYHFGKYSNDYITSSDVEMSKVDHKIQDLKNAVEKGECKLSDVSMDHVVDIYDDDPYSDWVSQKYGIAENEKPRYSGSFSIIGGEKLNAAGNKVRGQFVNHKARGIRNNNPGNLRISDCQWLGKVPIKDNTDGAFEQFVFPEFGIRALTMNLKNYQTKYNLYTVRGMITKYAPSCENNTNVYIQHVCKSIGCGADDKIDFRDPNVNYPMIVGIIKHENGCQPYDEKLVKRAISAGLGVEELTVDTNAGTMSNDQYEDSGAGYHENTPMVPYANASTPTADLIADSSELQTYSQTLSPKLDLEHLNPAFAQRLSSASKEYFQTYNKKLTITSGYRTDEDQARVVALKALGDPYIMDKTALPTHDVFFPNGTELADTNGMFSAKVGSKKINSSKIIVESDGIIVRGGGHSEHNDGLAVDISTADVDKFRPIAEKYGLWQSEGQSDNVHFALKDKSIARNAVPRTTDVVRNISDSVKDVITSMSAVKATVDTISTVPQAHNSVSDNTTVINNVSGESNVETGDKAKKEAFFATHDLHDNIILANGILGTNSGPLAKFA